MRSGTAIAAFLGMAVVATAVVPANAIVYCQYVGVPAGCVVRHGVVLAPAPHVVAPHAVAPHAVAPHAGAPGVGVAPGVGAPGVGVAPGVGAPGTPANRGGPVDRVGRR